MAGNGKKTNGNGNGAPHVPKLEPEAEEEFFEALELGMPIKRALALVGIPSTTYYRLRDYAEKAKNGKLKAWWDRLNHMRARGELANLRTVRHGKTKGEKWGAAWLLERSWGYYKTEKREEQHEHSGAVVIVVKRLEVSEDDRRK